MAALRELFTTDVGIVFMIGMGVFFLRLFLSGKPKNDKS